MARCRNCGREVDVEFDTRGQFSMDGDYTCSNSCKRSDLAKTLREADLPYNESDITDCSRRNGYDP